MSGRLSNRSSDQSGLGRTGQTPSGSMHSQPRAATAVPSRATARTVFTSRSSKQPTKTINRPISATNSLPSAERSSIQSPNKAPRPFAAVAPKTNSAKTTQTPSAGSRTYASAVASKDKPNPAIPSRTSGNSRSKESLSVFEKDGHESRVGISRK